MAFGLDSYSKRFPQSGGIGFGAPPTPAAPTGYNINPAPTGYNPTFGGVPGPLGLPDPYGDLTKSGVNLPALNPAASSAIGNELRGDLDPLDIAALQDESARFGVTSGMPGAGLGINRYLGNILGAREQRRNQGFQHYNQFVPTVAGTQTVNPALQNQIAETNALYGSAPVPAFAASYAQQLFDKYAQSLRGPGGGTRGPSSEAPTGSTAGRAFGQQFGQTPSDSGYNPYEGVTRGVQEGIDYTSGLDAEGLPASFEPGYEPGGVPGWEPWMYDLFEE
jgi:hypothetical protein